MAEGDRYVTVTPALKPALKHQKFNVSIRKEGHGEEYFITRISAAMPEPDAQALARSWAAAMQLEIR